MSKIIKSLSVLLITVVFCTSIVFAVNAADVEYVYNGYHYSLNENNMAVLCGWDNDSSTNLVIPDKLGDIFVAEIESFGFKNNKVITSVDFSNPTKFDNIGTYAFEGCSGLSGMIVLPRKISFIGDAAFKDCSSIDSVEINSNTDSVSRLCFSGCSSLKNVIINAGAKEIEAYAFQNCISLGTITISKTVTNINSTAFNGCGEFTIKCYKDSYAEQYAKDNGISYEILDPLYGDANEDGEVNILDVTFIQKYKIGTKAFASAYGEKCADVNKSGDVTIRDATLIQMKIAKIIENF